VLRLTEPASTDRLAGINGLFLILKRSTRSLGRLFTINNVIFVIAGKLNFSNVNHYAPLPLLHALFANDTTELVNQREVKRCLWLVILPNSLPLKRA
jgi:hypothetical protein